MTSVDLTIGGMTCASCASRIERRLNRLDGVVASVNYALRALVSGYLALVVMAVMMVPAPTQGRSGLDWFLVASS
jgi:copper chaperone CopZ